MGKKKSSVPVETASPRRQLSPFGANDMLAPFSRLRDEFDRMFDDRPGNALASRWMQKFYDNVDPLVELRDKKDEYELVAEVPGMGSDDIEIKLSDSMLRISGEKTETHEEDGESFMFSERQYGSFERLIKLPNGIDDKKISADVKDGLLIVHIPKSPEAIQKERKIPIRAS
ncbi:Hsp20/alpha crystallin family protein [Parasphingorhabdus sp.]|uniref:Hsp20/alpha crystallin family protein n=1 Tax=Parasphingorhabdus sp. TaxID=2709688 RepID=UPI003A90203F